MDATSSKRKGTSSKIFTPITAPKGRPTPMPVVADSTKRKPDTHPAPDTPAPKKRAIAGSTDLARPVVTPVPRSTRSASRNEALRKELSGPDSGVPMHFGVNVTPYVKTAIAEGGSLDDTRRHRMKGEIDRGERSGDSWESVVPGFVASHLGKHPKDKVFSQNDLRVDPRRSQSYEGFMVTSTRVNTSHGDVAEEKTIAEPASPKPHGSNDRSHASPFALAGADTNQARTVWAPKWANITVDGHVEKKAKAEPRRAETFHFRFDTARESTVGYASHDPTTGKFRSLSTNYQRRYDKPPAKKGGSSKDK